MQERGTSQGLSIDVVGKAVAFPFTHFLTLVKIGLLPWLLSYLVAYGVTVVFSPDKANDFFPDNIALINQNTIIPKLLTNLVDVFVAALIAVGIHRAIISQEQQDWTIIRLKKSDIAYLIVGAALYIAFIAPLYTFLVIQSVMVSLPLHGIDWYGLIDPDRLPISSIIPQLGTGSYGFMIMYNATLIVSLLIDIRFAMAFPHAAVSGTVSLRAAWTIMKDKFWPFLGLVIVFGITMSIMSIPIFYIVSTGLAPSIATEGSIITPLLLQHKFVIECVGLFWGLMLFAMMIAFVSYCYVGLTGGTAVRQSANTDP